MVGDSIRSAAPAERLIGDARLGIRGAWGALYESYSELVFRVATQVLGNHEAAEDVVQDVFLRLPRDLEGFEYRSEAALAAWFRRCTVRAAYARLARRRRRSRMDGVVRTSTPRPASASPSAIDARLDLERALARLPAPARQVILLHDVEGFTHAEIARELGILEPTSRSRLKRARRHLRTILGS